MILLKIRMIYESCEKCWKQNERRRCAASGNGDFKIRGNSVFLWTFLRMFDFVFKFVTTRFMKDIYLMDLGAWSRTNLIWWVRQVFTWCSKYFLQIGWKFLILVNVNVFLNRAKIIGRELFFCFQIMIFINNRNTSELCT